MDRRDFIKTANVAVGAALVGTKAGKAATVESEKDKKLGVLIDTTRCLGCRMCEYACADANGLPEPSDDDSVLDKLRNTSPTQYTVINRYKVDDKEIFVKRQCMHCTQPACATACLTKAMYKTPEGPVIWREDKCMGCRFCMVSCPFDVPKFEYDKAVPKIRKCIMCYERIKDGKQPACVENCLGNGVLVFGKRGDLLQIARKRMVENPDTYVNHIYGEYEVGGTECLYLAAVPFEKLGFRTNLGSTPYPEKTKEFLYSVPVVITLLPPFLLALSRAYTDNKANKEGEDSNER